MVTHLVLPIWLGAILAAFVTPLAYKTAQYLHLIDIPGQSFRKIHKRATYRAGGLLLFFALLAGIALLRLWQDASIRSLMLAALPVFVFGLIDDRASLSALWKLVGQMASAVLLILLGIQTQLHTHLHLPVVADWAITLLWVVGVTNAFNLVDSMDGLAVGLAGIALTFFLFGMWDSAQLVWLQFCSLLLGIIAIVYYLNAHPAQIFLGDSGAQLLGFLLAGLGILYTPPNLPQASSWFVPILILGVPIFDTTLVTISRLRRRRSISEGGLDHTYHRLVALGMPPTRAVLAIHLAALFLGSTALIALNQAPLVANGLFVAILLLGGVMVGVFEQHPVLREYLAHEEHEKRNMKVE